MWGLDAEGRVLQADVGGAAPQVAELQLDLGHGFLDAADALFRMERQRVEDEGGRDDGPGGLGLDPLGDERLLDGLTLAGGEGCIHGVLLFTNAQSRVIQVARQD